jgi:hypothetical protein
MKEDSISDVIFQLISAIVSVIAGLFLIMQTWQMSDRAAFIIGLIMAFIGVLVVQIIGVKSLIPIFLGFYFMGRASGLIENEYLRYIVGIPLILLGCYISINIVLRAQKQSGN